MPLKSKAASREKQRGHLHFEILVAVTGLPVITVKQRQRVSTLPLPLQKEVKGTLQVCLG